MVGKDCTQQMSLNFPDRDKWPAWEVSVLNVLLEAVISGSLWVFSLSVNNIAVQLSSSAFLLSPNFYTILSNLHTHTNTISEKRKKEWKKKLCIMYEMRTVQVIKQKSSIIQFSLGRTLASKWSEFSEKKLRKRKKKVNSKKNTYVLLKELNKQNIKNN